MKSHIEITHYTKTIPSFGTWKIERVHVSNAWHLTVKMEQVDSEGRSPRLQLMPYSTPEEAAYAAADAWAWPELPAWNQFRPQSKEEFHLSKWKPHNERVVNEL